MRIFFYTTLLFYLHSGSASADDIADIFSGYRKYADISVLNKITANSELVSLSENEYKIIGDVKLVVKKCWASTEFEEKQNAALIEIISQKDHNFQTELFYNWLFFERL